MRSNKVLLAFAALAIFAAACSPEVTTDPPPESSPPSQNTEKQANQATGEDALIGGCTEAFTVRGGPGAHEDEAAIELACNFFLAYITGDRQAAADIASETAITNLDPWESQEDIAGDIYLRLEDEIFKIVIEQGDVAVIVTLSLDADDEGGLIISEAHYDN